MKSATKSLLLITLMKLGQLLHATPIQIFHENESERATWIKEIFVKSYLIPEGLIEIFPIESCLELKTWGILDLCVDKEKQLNVISIDQGFIKESLSIFKAP